jgi:hypothetical protein
MLKAERRTRERRLKDGAARTEAKMPKAKHNCRVKKLFKARRAAANDFWWKIPPDGQLRQLVS